MNKIETYLIITITVLSVLPVSTLQQWTLILCTVLFFCIEIFQMRQRDGRKMLWESVALLVMTVGVKALLTAVRYYRYGEVAFHWLEKKAGNSCQWTADPIWTAAELCCVAGLCCAIELCHLTSEKDQKTAFRENDKQSNIQSIDRTTEPMLPGTLLVISLWVVQNSFWGKLVAAVTPAAPWQLVWVCRCLGTAVVIGGLHWLRRMYGRKRHINYLRLYVLLTPVICFLLSEITYSSEWTKLYVLPAMAGVLVYAVFFLLLYGLLGDIRAAMVVNYVLAFAWGLLNSYLVRFKDNPLLAGDLRAARTGISVMARYDYSLHGQNYMGLCLLLMAAGTVMVFRKRLIWSIGNWFKRCVMVTAAAGALVFVVCSVDVKAVMGESGFSWWNMAETYAHNGTLLSFIACSQFAEMKEPEGYSTERAEQILAEYDGEILPEAEQSEALPNLIVIMNEAYSDLRFVGEFGTTAEYMPCWNSLDNAVKGCMFVSVYGNYTANTEFEFLTGNTLLFYPQGSVPYQQYIEEPVSQNLVRILQKLDYDCIAVHPYEREGWNRPAVYEAMGFREFISQEDFENPRYIRNLISDWSSYEKDIELFETRDPSKPLFIFNVTVQNHGGYWEDTIPDNGIYLEGLSGEYEDVEHYLSLIRESDRALEMLISYFQNVEEPTVIVMFGDHQPAVDNAFYEEIMQKSTSEWKLEDLQKKYQVPYFIWANYDLEAEEEDTCAAYLQTKVLEVMGIDGGVYPDFLKAVKQQIPILNANGYMTADGSWHERDEQVTGEVEMWLEKYRYVQYRNAFD